jgi:hypothetical protein
MKLLLLHLSDIHFDVTNNYVYGRVREIVRALRELNTSVDDCVVVVSGDIAQNGLADEYLVASSFFETLGRELTTELKCAIRWVVAPGNHDCVLPERERVVRETFVDAVRRDMTRINDEQMLATCTAPQDAFFRFLGDFAPPTELSSKLWYEYRFAISDSTVVFRVLNTAWVSERAEVPAKLIYPVDHLPAPVHAGAIAVTVFHHPSNWLQPDNARAFRKAVESSSDLVLTGHEHEPANYVKEDSCGTRSEYVEGAVLQHRDSGVPTGFNAVVLDLHRNEKSIAHFTWEADKYLRATPTIEWRRFSRNRISARRVFDPSERHVQWLEEPGLQLTISAKADLTLSDFFVWPDFKEVSYTKKSLPPISGATFLAKITGAKKILLAGADKSGKTAVCKQLFRHIASAGFVPVLLSCCSTQLKSSTAVSIVEKMFAQQYSRDDLNAFRQLPPAKRAIIVDDLHRLSLTRAGKIELLDRLAAIADVVVVATDDLAYQIDDIVYSKESRGAALDFTPYRITQFGHLQRYALAEKWFAINLDASEAREKFRSEWPRLARVFDTIVGRKFVQSYPVFLLSLLQANETSREVDTKASTYGYFFETFIRESLAATSQRFDPITKREYLARLARTMYDRRVTTIAESELRDFHRDHELTMQMNIEFTAFVSDLAQAGILLIEGAKVRFKYSYTYYYFVALHLRDRLTENTSRQAVVKMAKQLHVEEFANVMLFLAHLSRDGFIVGTMLEEAKQLYYEFAPAELGTDVAFVNGDGATLQLEYVESDIVLSRKRALNNLDEYERDRDADVMEPTVCENSSMDEPDEFGPLMRMNTALKTLQILGQMLKNFAGALDGRTKLDIARECYSLGLRVLGAALSYLEHNKDAVYTDMFHILRRDHPETKEDALLRRANGALFYFAEIMSFGIVKRVSSALGSENLLLTYKAIRERDDSPAVGLIDLSLQLDHKSDLPQASLIAFGEEHHENALVSALVCDLALAYFDLFDVPPKIKQRLCAKLKISYRPALPIERKQLLLAPSRTKRRGGTSSGAARTSGLDGGGTQPGPQKRLKSS